MELSSLTLETEYRTGESDLIRQFYEPCLSRSISYDRAVGYFRSSVFAVVGRSILEFAKGGGRIRLVCSPDLTKEDQKAVANGYKSRKQIIESALDRDITDLISNPESKELTEILATLITYNHMDVRIAFRRSDFGIFHEKIGIFVDSNGHAVTFKGSANETKSAWTPTGNRRPEGFGTQERISTQAIFQTLLQR